jgi:hypothetical protein
MEQAIESTDQLLENINPETGAPPPSRIKDGYSLRTIWEELEKADETSGYNRSLVRQLLNGNPPFDQGEREEEGTGDLFNVNTGNGRLIVDESTSGIMDIFASERTLTEIPLDDRVVDGPGMQKLIEDEFSKMLHDWSAFAPRVNNLCHTFAADGISTLFFEDDDTWYFNSCGLKDVKFPRYVEPVSEKIPIAIMRKSIHVGELWRHIQDPEEAEKKGWNVEVARRVILHYSTRRKKDRWRDWESLEQELKSNELYVSSVGEPVEVLYGFVEEFDGSISLKMGAANGEVNEKDFLYERPDNYKDANEVFQVFPFSTGHDNSLYTVRGMGYFIYQACNAENIMYCKMLDAARIGSSLIYQPSGTEDLEDASFQDMGHGLMIPPGVNIPERAQAPNLTQTLGPALEMVRSGLNRVSGGLSEGPTEMGDRANEATVSLNLEQLNKMNAFSITLFYPPLDRTYREIVRRVFLEDKDTKESLEMKARLEKLGVTKEMWRRIDITRVKARRILMGANKTARILQLNHVRKLIIGEMDDQGRKESAHDTPSETLGREYAKKYMGNPEQTRTTHDDWIAELEISQMLDGHEFEAKDGQDHLVHLRLKIEQMLSTKQGVEEGTLELTDYTLKNLPIYENAQGHLAMLVVDPSLEEEAGALRQALQQLGELFTNGMRAIQKEQRDAEAQEPVQEGGGEEVEQEMTPFQLQLADEERKNLANQAEIDRKNVAHAAQMARDAVKDDINTSRDVKQR